MIRYFADIKKGKIVLWCYLIWYLVSISFYFDPSPNIWLNSLGISVVIGLALVLSVSNPSEQGIEHWQVFRLFLMPFCVSSFSSLIKDHGFIFVIPPRLNEQIIAVGSCLLFIFGVYTIKFFHKK